MKAPEVLTHEVRLTCSVSRLIQLIPLLLGLEIRPPDGSGQYMVENSFLFGAAGRVDDDHVVRQRCSAPQNAVIDESPDPHLIHNRERVSLAPAILDHFIGVGRVQADRRTPIMTDVGKLTSPLGHSVRSSTWSGFWQVTH